MYSNIWESKLNLLHNPGKFLSSVDKEYTELLENVLKLYLSKNAIGNLTTWTREKELSNKLCRYKGALSMACLEIDCLLQISLY